MSRPLTPAGAYTSPPVEPDPVQTARVQGAALFRVIVQRRDGTYGRLCHYFDADPSKALGMALDLARVEAGRGALVERIDPVSAAVVGAAMAPAVAA